jgi:hypothetical protein
VGHAADGAAAGDGGAALRRAAGRVGHAAEDFERDAASNAGHARDEWRNAADAAVKEVVKDVDDVERQLELDAARGAAELGAADAAVVRDAGLHRFAADTKGAAPAAPAHPSADTIATMFFNDVLYEPYDIVALLATNGGDVDMACGLDFYYSFYDTWVTRDIDGNPFTPYPPFVTAPATQRAFARAEPAKVRCCWNGVAVMRAAIFLAPSPALRTAEGIRFRANHSKSDCYSAECQHICADMHLRGYDKIYVNPTVRITYEEYFHRLHHRASSWLGLGQPGSVMYGAFAWARVWSWPLFYSEPDHAHEEGGMACMRVEDNLNMTFFDTVLWLAAAASVAVACRILWCTAHRRQGNDRKHH